MFEDVVGQGHITTTLQNAITTNRLAHAFLFSGPRGVGKTTTARILAKALNCKEGPTPHPCGKCDSCLETAAGNSVDVIEIDGASNRGIEHIRELRETVRYAPVGGKYKVYVIDEVHMLTNEAFNALLKTLEEPPPHVLFIFATTEPQKIPATIHSRCQRYGFKRISLQEISEKLRQIADREGITISERGLSMIARAAEGSMRDSQSLLDQAISYSGSTIKDDELQAIFGAIGLASLMRFAQGLLERDAAGLLKLVDAMLERGQDLRQLLAGVVEHIRNLIVVSLSEKPEGIVEFPTADLELLRQQAATTDREQLLLLFDSLSRTLEELRWSPHQRYTLEIGLVKACSVASLKPIGELLERLASLEAALADPAASIAPRSLEHTHDRPAPSYGSVRPRTHSTASPSASAADAGDVWGQVITQVKQKRPGVGNALAGSKIVERKDPDVIVGITTKFQLDLVEKKETRELIEQITSAVLGGNPRITFRLLAAETRPAGKPAAAPKRSTPREPDPLVHDALSIFNGSVIDQEPSEDS